MIRQLSKRLTLYFCLLDYTGWDNRKQTWFGFLDLYLEDIIQSLWYPVLIFMSQYHQRFFPISDRMIPIVLEYQICQFILIIQNKLFIYFSFHQSYKLLILMKFLRDECFIKWCLGQTLFFIMGVDVKIAY